MGLVSLVPCHGGFGARVTGQWLQNGAVLTNVNVKREHQQELAAEHREPPHSRRIGAKVVFCMIKSYKVLFRANLPNLHSAFLGSTAPGPAAKQTTKPTTVCIKEQH